MIDLESKWNAVNDDVKGVSEWVDKIYNEYFAEYFNDERKLYKILETSCKVTDDELEWILTTLPLELFSVSEKLSQFKISEEVIKLKNRETLNAKIALSNQPSDSKKKEEADNSMLEDKLLLSVCVAVSDRVDREISFSRELIMSAKKIWDARRKQEDTGGLENNVKSDNLPEYTVDKKTYVR